MEDNFYRDKDGVPYKHPERTCSGCALFPCLELFVTRKDKTGEIVSPEHAIKLHLVCDFAKYGCTQFEKRIVYPSIK